MAKKTKLYLFDNNKKENGVYLDSEGTPML